VDIVEDTEVVEAPVEAPVERMAFHGTNKKDTMMLSRAVSMKAKLVSKYL
jgi:hypothetical protein